jgi:hypothetical protein
MEGIILGTLFPTDGVVPEARQIGRAGTIRRLTTRLVEGHSTLLLEPRRVGKTSVALAALEHCRADHGALAVGLDLQDPGTRTPSQMVASIVDQAARQQAGAAVAGLRRSGRLRRSARALEGPVATAAAELFQTADAEKLAAAVAESLSPQSDLASVLKALELDGVAAHRRVVVFVDEIQALGSWAEDGVLVEEQLAAALKGSGQIVTFLFCGSERGAVKAVFAEGRALHHAGLGFGLDAISPEDWHSGLRERFAEGGFAIGVDELDDILGASGGHPLRTMQICAHVYEWAQNTGGDEVTGAAVLRGIATASEHPSWREADE